MGCISNLILVATSPAAGDKMPHFNLDWSKEYVSNNLALKRAKNFKEMRKQIRISLEWNLSPYHVVSEDELNHFIKDQMKKPINSVQVVKAQWRALKVFDGIDNLKLLDEYAKQFGFGILIIHGDCDKT